MIGMAPTICDQLPALSKKKKKRRQDHTHCDAHTEQPTNNLVHDVIQILIARLGAVDLVVAVIAKTQTE